MPYFFDTCLQIQSYEDVFKEFLFDDPASVSGTLVTMNGEDVGSGAEYRPDQDAGLFETVFHPLYGNCYSFGLPEAAAAARHDNRGGIRRVRVDVDLWAAFPPSPDVTTARMMMPPVTPPGPTNGTTEDYYEWTTPNVILPPAEESLWQQGAKLNASKVFTEHSEEYPERIYEAGFGTVPVFIYERESILISKNIAVLDFDQSETYYTTFELIDKTEIKEVAECEDDPDYSEDDCLYQCLVGRFTTEFGCVHARLRFMGFEHYDNIPACTAAHWNETDVSDVRTVQQIGYDHILLTAQSPF